MQEEKLDDIFNIAIDEDIITTEKTDNKCVICKNKDTNNIYKICDECNKKSIKEFRERYYIHNNRIFFQTVEDGDLTTHWPINIIDNLKTQIKEWITNNHGSNVIHEIKYCLEWLKCLNEVFKNTTYALKEQEHWILEYNASFILLTNWIIILFKFKEILFERDIKDFNIIGNKLQKGSILGKFVSYTNLENDFKNWISHHRNPVAHSSPIRTDDKANWKITFSDAQDNNKTWEVDYLMLFNQCRRLTLFFKIIFE